MPGVGHILSLVLLDAIHQSERFPRGQEFAAYGRLGKCRKEAGGKRLGTSGKKIGTAHLKGAVADAATLFWRPHPQGQQLLARWEKKPDQGNALRLLAPKLGRAVYARRQRQVAFAMPIFLQPSGSRAGAPGASLDS